MKNIITLIMVVVCSSQVVAQKQMSQEQIRVLLANGMVSFVESVKPAYVVGMSYESFQNLLTGGSRPTTEGSNLIRKAHQFISQKYSDRAIIDNYSGLEMASALVKLHSLNENRSVDLQSGLFTTSTGNFNPYQNKRPRPTSCYWYQMSCHTGDNADQSQFECYLATLNGTNCN